MLKYTVHKEKCMKPKLDNFLGSKYTCVTTPQIMKQKITSTSETLLVLFLSYNSSFSRVSNILASMNIFKFYLFWILYERNCTICLPFVWLLSLNMFAILFYIAVMSGIHSFALLFNILLYEYNTIYHTCLFIRNIWIVSNFWLS